ncbi:MAG: family 20 glycosylhydrolase [Chlorobi bacterium]|nr:family 20 glycosylhydrolase [Chlorobiota bacterium]
MKKILIYSVIILLFPSCSKNAEIREINIIPAPNHLEIKKGYLDWNNIDKISAPDKFKDVTTTFIEELKARNIHIPASEQVDANKNVIKIIFSENLSKEGYELSITPETIIIKASEPNGCYYAFQSLKQLLPFGTTKNNILLPALYIKDKPRFRYRGMHIDVSRHFFTVEEIKQYIDVISQYKINHLHMHLTDDQGWRIEIEKYPLLTEKGAWRTYNNQDSLCMRLAKEDPTFEIPQDRIKMIDGKQMYGGFYSKAEMRDIIAYAASKQIEIVPEIDVPGHFMAAIESYPFLSCKGEAGWGELFSTPACLGKETTYTFIENVLGEVVDLFPGEYLHIGGDEVNIKSWKECPKDQAMIKKLHLKNEHELQTYFNRQIERFLKSKGKKLLGWDEIAEGGLTKEATVMWWRNWASNTLDIAAKNGNDIILTPDFEYYFDFPYSATPVSKVYNFEPVPERFTPEMAKYIIGIQANVWTERIPNTKRLYYMILPRMLALAETGWTNKANKNFDRFYSKAITQQERFIAQGLFYHLPELKGIEEKVVFTDSAVLKIDIPLNDMKVFYTTDGSAPTPSSKEYTSPVIIRESYKVRIRSYRGNVFSRIYESVFEKQIPLEPVKAANTIKGITRTVYKGKFRNAADVPEKLEPVEKSEINNIDLSGYKKAEWFGMVFTGYFNAEKDGIYTFYTISDDGDQFYIGDKLIVDNKGPHAWNQRKGMIYLKKGLHPITEKYYQGAGGSILEIWIKPPGEEKRKTFPEDWRTTK